MKKMTKNGWYSVICGSIAGIRHQSDSSDDRDLVAPSGAILSRIKFSTIYILYRYVGYFLKSFGYYVLLFFIQQHKGKHRNERIVAIVLSWKRIENIPRVVFGLKKQSYIDDIIIFHNHPSWLYIPGCKNIFSKKNLGSIVRHEIAANLNMYDYFIFSDDDLMLDDDFSAEIISTIRVYGKESVLGFFGHNLNFENKKETYTFGTDRETHDEIIPTDIVKGRFHIISQEGIQELVKSEFDTAVLRGEDDIRASVILQYKFKKPSFLIPIKHKIIELPAPYALNYRDHHAEYRDQAVLEALRLGWVPIRAEHSKKQIIQ